MQQAETTADLSRDSAKVAEMFNRISRRYDLANSVLSFGIHHLWRRSLVRMVPKSQSLQVLDLCTGTGDLLPILKARFGTVTGADFSIGMLKAGEQRRIGNTKFDVVQATALKLPFRPESFDIVSVAFGVRNFEDLRSGLREIARVLKPGGNLLVLEFGQPKGIFGKLFKLYSTYIIPIIGGFLTGDRQAYEYLPKTSATFPCAKDFEIILKECGFVPQLSKPLTGGIAYAYCAQKKMG